MHSVLDHCWGRGNRRPTGIRSRGLTEQRGGHLEGVWTYPSGSQLRLVLSQGGDSWMVAVIGGSTAPDVEEVGLRGSCRTRDLTGRARGALVEKC